MRDSPEPLRAGVVGAGLMGGWHAAAAARAGARVAVVIDPDAARARSLAQKYRGATSAALLEDVLSPSSLDVLHVCAPPAAHYEIAARALDAGLHLIVEKPLAPTADETKALYQRAAERGALVCPAHQFLFQDGTLKARTWLPRIGRLVHLEATFCSAGGGRRAGDELDAVAAEILPHPLSLLECFLPGGIGTDHLATGHPEPGELRASGERAGVTWAILVSLRARPPVCAFELFGSEGAIHLDLFHGFAVLESGRVSKAQKIARPLALGLKGLSAGALNLGRRVVTREMAYPGLRRLVGSFYQAVRVGGASPVTPAEAIAVAQARDWLRLSAGLLPERVGSGR
jgi:predicted dehydrogenase